MTPNELVAIERLTYFIEFTLGMITDNREEQSADFLFQEAFGMIADLKDYEEGK